MASRNLTLGQVAVVTTLRNYQHIHGYQPSIREICQTLGKARGTIFQQIAALERKGVIRRHRGKARAIEILQAA